MQTQTHNATIPTVEILDQQHEVLMQNWADFLKENGHPPIPSIRARICEVELDRREARSQFDLTREILANERLSALYSLTALVLKAERA